MFKRLFLMFGVNILIIAMLSIVLSLLGVGHYMTAYGINYESLMIFCLVWGMGGAFISLMISKFMAKTMMGVKIIDNDPQYVWLVQMVHNLARQANLTTMPEVGIYQADEMNAFATGPSRNNSLVAVSTGILHKMSRDELEGVLGHEISHISNGDMVTMTLVQGVVNAFVMFFARIAAYALSQAMRGDDDDGPGMGYLAHMLTVFAFEIVFGILGSIAVAAFSRFREFKADHGGAQLAGRHKMIAALRALQRNYEALSNERNAMSSLQISSKGSLMALLSTHPQLEERIKRLESEI